MNGSRFIPVDLLRWLVQTLSPGGTAVLALAVLSAVALAFVPIPERNSLQFWTFARMHAAIYGPALNQWNTENPASRVDMTVFSMPALERRTMSAFLARTAMAELLEVERTIAQRAFGGPLEDVGFVDLTDRLREEGLLERINQASFSPWTSRGRIFGIPHDVHPVMLAYRGDLVDAAGIDLSGVETWEDYFRAMKPLMADDNGDGEPDRYLLSFWDTHAEQLEVLLLQADGGFFDEAGKPVIASEVNASVMARLAVWIGGPDRVCADAPDFSAGGNELKIRGYIVGFMMPDWMCDIYQNEMPQLAGKLRLMPLPAWERGGRRTSIWGGSMIGISRTAPDFEKCWEIAKELYLSPDSYKARASSGDIISPVRSNWSDPIYDRPDPFFGGQPKGRMYVDLASQIPMRPSSPFTLVARARVQEGLMALVRIARERKATSPEQLMDDARRVLAEAERRVREVMERNRFHSAQLEATP